jgi:hypothetical protein
MADAKFARTAHHFYNPFIINGLQLTRAVRYNTLLPYDWWFSRNRWWISTQRAGWIVSFTFIVSLALRTEERVSAGSVPLILVLNEPAQARNSAS